MPAIRRRLAPLAALLALVVLAEVTDAVPCGDADCGVWSVVSGGDAPPDGGAPDNAPETACICHATFVRSGAAPRGPAPGDTPQARAEAPPDWTGAGPADVPHPPPLA